MKKKTGLVIMLCAVLLGFGETWYFGWNWVPESRAEFVLDMIVINACWFGYVLASYSRVPASRNTGS